MTTSIVAFEMALIRGDLSGLSTEEKLSYYKKVCESLRLNPLTKPFEFIKMNGKEVMYATKNCGDQLRERDSISLQISSREKIGDVYVVTARAKTKEGREDESTGAVTISGLRGEALANAYMKCETKAKRRVTLSICGLGMLDESEVIDIPRTAKEVHESSRQVFENRVASKITEVSNGAPSGDNQEVHSDDSGPGEYRIKFGKEKGKALKDFSKEALSELVKKARTWFRGEHKAHPTVQGFILQADLYLRDLDSLSQSREPPVDEEEVDSGPSFEDDDPTASWVVPQLPPIPVVALGVEIKGNGDLPAPKQRRSLASPNDVRDLMQAVTDKNVSQRLLMNYIRDQGATVHELPNDVMTNCYTWLSNQGV